MRYFARISRAITAVALGILVSISVASFPAFASTTSSLHQSAHSSASSCLQPPQNVDLMTLSDSALLSYGLPTHAIINHNPIFWAQDFAHAKHRTCSTGTSLTRYHHYHSFVPSTNPSHVHNGGQSANWSDNQATGARGTYRDASAEFNVPYISLSSQSPQVSVWAGIGGDPNYAGPHAELPQVGVNVSPSGKTQYNESWYEIAGSSTDNGEINLPLKKLANGDRVRAFASSNDGGDGYDYFSIENETRNDFASIIVSGSSYLSDSATGECVVERPRMGKTGPFYPLAEFDPTGPKTEQLDSCSITDLNGTTKSVGNWTHTYYSMYNGGNLLAYPKPLFNGGASFLIQWVASQ